VGDGRAAAGERPRLSVSECGGIGVPAVVCFDCACFDRSLALIALSSPS
jgi:hypothetical protein